MAYSYVQYTAGAGQDTFAITFAYLKQAHVHVYVDSVEEVDFSIVASDVVLDTPAVGGELVEVRRITPSTLATFLVTHQDGQSSVAEDFNTDRTQLLYIIQELVDVAYGDAPPPPPGGTGGGIPDANAADDMLVAAAAGANQYVSTARATVRALLNCIAAATDADEFAVSTAAGEDGWAPLSREDVRTLLNILFDPSAADRFIVSSASGEGGWAEKTASEVKTLLGIGGGGSGPGMLEFRWQGPTNEGSTVNDDYDDGPMRSIPSINTLNHRIRMSAVVPIDFDVTADFTLHVLFHVNTGPDDGTFDLDLFKIVDGFAADGPEGAADVEADLTIVAAELAQHNVYYKTIAVSPGSALSGANALWLRIKKNASFTGQYGFPHVWITY